ncbi:glutamine-synthetase adenylyltransferase [Seohaeicola nanhaiensis]|uniref:Glutamine-synthetase adenylyltransferase n=1 Tax=Seohaeicola nanhaiensis TaxID=1387282 RepID=A0ABV9KF37_9RHOB
MSNRLVISRLPRPFQTDLGDEALAAVPGLNRDHADLLRGTAGSSPYLKSLIEAEADWLPGALDDPDAALAAIMGALPEIPRDRLSGDLRQAKRRVALILALADLAGAWPLEKVTGALSDFAAAACEAALRAEIAALVRRGKLPGQGEGDVATAAGMVVLAMGKMGAGELNYSSDIDLICLFDETRYGADDFHEARQAMVKATRAFTATLGDRTAEGYVFRTDLRLRPDPSVTPVCLSIGAAESYYESLGRTWERAAYIKARPCAGDIAAGERFIASLRPFIWRRHLDFAAIQDAHDMRLRIRESKRLGGPLTVMGHDMKLGRGGIREIEFFTQTRQLIAGGRDESLRVRGTVEGLAALAAKGWVPPEVAQQLTGHYRAHREVEHRIQMLHDAQTHKLPTSEEEFERLACLMGSDIRSVGAEVVRRLTEVHALTEDFFAPDARRQVDIPEAFDTSICKRWPTYAALRSQRARQIFDRLRPEMLARLSRTSKPDEALIALDGFLQGLPAGVQLFSLFEANAQLIDLLVDIVGTSPALAGYLSRNSGVFDAVIAGDFFAVWPGRDALTRELGDQLAREEDYETQLDGARRWMKEWHFRIGVHLLRGLIDGNEAGRQYADLADAVIATVFPVVQKQFAAKHGAPPGRGAAVLGMGSLGARRLNTESDLDLIVIYDPGEVESSDGPRPLATRPYYARLTQALITALTAPMAQGRLYEVDMRLRPSGTQGPVATSWASFRDYQQTSAWVWEHLALTRARVVAGGAEGLAADIEAFRRELLSQPRDRDHVLKEVRDMRARIAEAKSPRGLWDIKTGPGRLQDIELVAQAGALLSGTPERDVLAGLAGGINCGWLPPADGDALAGHYRLFWQVQTARRLLSEDPAEDTKLGEGGRDFLCRSAGFESIEVLRGALADGYGDAAERIDRVLGEETEQ